MILWIVSEKVGVAGFPGGKLKGPLLYNGEERQGSEGVGSDFAASKSVGMSFRCTAARAA